MRKKHQKFGVLDKLIEGNLLELNRHATSPRHDAGLLLLGHGLLNLWRCPTGRYWGNGLYGRTGLDTSRAVWSAWLHGCRINRLLCQCCLLLCLAVRVRRVGLCRSSGFGSCWLGRFWRTLSLAALGLAACCFFCLCSSLLFGLRGKGIPHVVADQFPQRQLFLCAGEFINTHGCYLK